VFRVKERALASTVGSLLLVRIAMEATSANMNASDLDVKIARGLRIVSYINCQSICEHGCRKDRCDPCGGRTFCPHGKRLDSCTPCNPPKANPSIVDHLNNGLPVLFRTDTNRPLVKINCANLESIPGGANSNVFIQKNEDGSKSILKISDAFERGQDASTSAEAELLMRFNAEVDMRPLVVELHEDYGVFL
jgi:hypothetical protein